MNTYIGDGQATCSLSANNTSNTCLVLHNAIGDTHLPAQGRQEQDELK
jgi:hypothetical protein